MKWLAKMEIDSQIAYKEGIRDSYGWHRKLWECFPDEPDAERDFLTRIDSMEGAFRIWVLSERKPERPDWCPPEAFAVNAISPSFLDKRYYAFDLTANPVKTLVKRGQNGETLYQRDENGEIKLRADGKPKRIQGKRTPIVKQDELKAWLLRKAEIRGRNENGRELPGGFRIVDERPLEIRPMVESYFRKKDRKSGKEQSAYHGGVQFRGVLEVTDKEAFRETWKSGIGSGKGFGFSLLLLAPVNL